MRTNSSRRFSLRTGISDLRITAEAVAFGVSLLVLVAAPFVRTSSLALSTVLIYVWLMLTLLALAIWIYRPAISKLRQSLEGQLRRRRYITVLLRLVLYMIPIAVIAWGEYHLTQLILTKPR